MMPGNPRILSCPFCGKEKEIMSLSSGNSFGSTQWSDGKEIAPMMSEISFVQKCPECGKYYLPCRQEYRSAHYTNPLECENAFKTGRITYYECIEAYRQLSAEEFKNIDEEGNVKSLVFFRYNDFFYRMNKPGENSIPSVEDRELHKEIGLWIIENWLDDNLMKAEYYREIGEMGKAQSLLDSFVPENDFLKKVASSIQERINNNCCEVFVIKKLLIKK